MRIIAGKYRGRKLKSPPSPKTRPTSDRLRETLFNILAPRIEGARFLDLCAGSGAVGIEAWSRGATHVTFVDRSRKMCALIGQNLDVLMVDEDELEVIVSDTLEFLKRCARKITEPLDIVFFDPPYQADYEGVLNRIGEAASPLLSEDALVIVEHHKNKDLSGEFGRLKRNRVLKQGDSVLSFYELTGA